jgi:hypothetical protein
MTLECAEVLPEYFSRPENREIIVQLHKVGSQNYAESGAAWLRESLQPELVVQLESLLGKPLPQLDRKSTILAINICKSILMSHDSVHVAFNYY